MKGSFKLIAWGLVLSLIATFADGAPADKNPPAENTADSRSTTSTSQAGQEQVLVPNSADTRADPPASTGGSDAVPVSKPTATVGTFFDNIFNIPTSVLRAVNQFLNNNIKIGQAQSSKTAAAATAAPPNATAASAQVDVTTSPSVASATPSGASGASHNATARSSFFDNIFNIPISAINSVNSLITGRKFGDNGEKLPKSNNI